jgi:hypothetical protein
MMLEELAEEARFRQLSTQSKQLLDIVKMIAYHAETAMATSLREHQQFPLATCASEPDCHWAASSWCGHGAPSPPGGDVTVGWLFPLRTHFEHGRSRPTARRCQRPRGSLAAR